MAEDQEEGESHAPIIIKRKKKVVAGDGHGSSAWKIAYADFVTAMMAFFLLLWLLNVTTAEQRSGIADYFSPTPFSSDTATAGGDSFFSGSAIKDTPGDTSEGGMGVVPPVVTAGPKAAPGDPSTTGDGDKEAEKVSEAIRDKLTAEGMLEDFGKNVRVDRTREGIRIQIVDGEDFAMFYAASADMRPRAESLLANVTEVVRDMPQDVVIEGHTDAARFSSDSDYNNWDLSSERANTARRVMRGAELARSRIARVEGHADTNPLTEDPYEPANRRIAIILLRGTGDESADPQDAGRADAP